MTYVKKETIILIYRILVEYTDEDHFLTQAQLIEKLKQIYNVEVERKSVANSIMLLQELDYDIVKGEHSGYALFSRTLDNNEIKFINDALFSSRVISGKQALEISNKLNSFLSKYQKKKYTYLYKSTDLNRTNNENVFLNLEIIEEAIEKNKKISFQYITYDENCKVVTRFNGFRFILSPYYLVNNFGKYYCLGHYRDKYKPLQNYRLEYMVDVQIENEDCIPINEVNGLENFEITKYLNEHIYIFSSKVINDKLEILVNYAVQYIYEYFGNNVKFYKQDEKTFVEVKCSYDALFYWVLQYSNCIKVIEPNELIERLKEFFYKENKKYN